MKWFFSRLLSGRLLHDVYTKWECNFVDEQNWKVAWNVDEEQILPELDPYIVAQRNGNARRTPSQCQIWNHTRELRHFGIPRHFLIQFCDCSILWLEISASLPDSRYNNTVLGDLFVFTVVDPLIPHLWPTFTTQLSLVPPGPPMVVNDPFYCIKYYLLCSALCWDQSFPDCWLTVATTARAECWAVTSPGSAQLW